jgi:hypothetical protein
MRGYLRTGEWFGIKCPSIFLNTLQVNFPRVAKTGRTEFVTADNFYASHCEGFCGVSFCKD